MSMSMSMSKSKILNSNTFDHDELRTPHATH